MTKLEKFYKSKGWLSLVETLRIERINSDGDLICAHCGKPIVKKYDCIGHHKIELTEDNVDDYTISLNGSNVDLIHFRCHNEIHQRFGGFKQRVFIVYGSPCAGKTTWVKHNAMPDDLILDLDSIWEAVSLADRYHKPKRLRANVFGIRDAVIDQIRTRTGLWRNAFVIGTYPLRTDRDRLCDLLRAEPVFIETDEDTCLERARTDEWKHLVREWFETFTA